MVDLYQLRDLQLLAVAMRAEADNQGLDGMVAVGSVVRTRVKNPCWWGSNYHEVLLKNAVDKKTGNIVWQFDCFRPGTANYSRVEKWAEKILSGQKDDRALEQAKYLATGIINDLILDNVRGADHYCRYDVWPAWRKVYPQVARIRDHVFYCSHGRNS